MENQYGLLLNQDAKLHRKWFEEMVSLLGVMVKYKPPVMDYTPQAEMKPLRYKDEITVGVIFEDHINQKTAKKLGWDAELTENAVLFHMPYDLEGLQIGGLVEIPSAYDNSPSRLFRITKMSSIMIYPASITCEAVPEFKDTMQRAEVEDFTFSNFNLLNGKF